MGLRSSEVRFCPRCGAALARREQAGRSRPSCPQCGFVWYQNPLPVAACIVAQAGAIVLIRRRWGPAQGEWALPAGFVEHAEEPAVAAVRETLEETGLTVETTGLVGVYGYREADGQRSGLVIAYQARVVSGALVAGDDAEAAAFFDLGAQRVDLAFATHRAALVD